MRFGSWQGGLSRRAVLRLAAALPTLPAFCPLPVAAGEADAAARLLSLLAHRDSAARIGRLYLRRFPGEADARRLASMILGQASAPAAAPSAPDALRRQVAQRRRQDFATGETVRVEGWILSRSEARLCALAALPKSRPLA